MKLPNGFKLNVNVLAEMEPPAPGQLRPEYCPPSLEDRVKYAISLIDANNSKKKEAIKFVRAVYNKLDKLHRKTEKQQYIMECIQPVLSVYGNHNSEELD